MKNFLAATAIAGAIYARDPGTIPANTEDMEDRLYEACRAADLSAEEKAETFAHLADSLTPKTPFEEAVKLVDAAIVLAQSPTP